MSELFAIRSEEINPSLTSALAPTRYLPKRINQTPSGLETSFMWAFVGTLSECIAKIGKIKHPRRSRYTFTCQALNEEQAKHIAAEANYKDRASRRSRLELSLSEDGTILCIAAAAKKMSKADQAFFDVMARTGTVYKFNDGRSYVNVRVKL